MARDPYRGRAYEDDPRALPPQPMRRLSIEAVSGCGCAAAICVAQGSPELTWKRRPAHERAIHARRA
jgi:hypothetical protein